MKVIELDNNYYQFVFSKEEEKEKALSRKPWFFANQILVLQPWKSGLTGNDESFSKVSLWIQAWGVPNQRSCKEVGFKIGKLFPHCSNVIVPENGRKMGRLLKLQVEIDLSKPLLRGTKLKLSSEEYWVGFKYEMLPTFCFYCGIIGHQQRKCKTKIRDAVSEEVMEGQYGEWLRHRYHHWEGASTTEEVEIWKGEYDRERASSREIGKFTGSMGSLKGGVSRKEEDGRKEAGEVEPVGEGVME